MQFQVSITSGGSIRLGACHAPKVLTPARVVTADYPVVEINASRYSAANTFRRNTSSSAGYVLGTTSVEQRPWGAILDLGTKLERSVRLGEPCVCVLVACMRQAVLGGRRQPGFSPEACPGSSV